jgi:transcriptional regulator GlxA family with amidase domain
MSRRRVGILVFDDVEVLDFCGPFEVFSVVRLDPSRRREDPSPYELALVAPRPGAVTASGGLRVLPDRTIDDPGELDLLLVPGGWGVRREIENQALVDWIGRHGRRVETLASVCTGSMLLGRAGLLDGLEATTHWQTLDWMRESLPAVGVRDDLHVVDAGRVLTSAGISAGIDLALRIVARHHGEAVARQTARYMEYPYPGSDARRVDLTSDAPPARSTPS